MHLVKFSTVLDVMGGIFKSLVPARLDILVPCDVLSAISMELPELLEKKAKYEICYDGRVEIINKYDSDFWASAIAESPSFNKWFEDMGESSGTHYASTDDVIFTRVENPFITLVNKDKVAKQIYVQAKNMGEEIFPTNTILNTVSKRVSKKIHSSLIVEEISAALANRLKEISDQTGLDKDLIMKEINSKLNGIANAS